MILAKKIPLCALTTLRLCVNKKRRPFKASYPAVDGISGFARKKNISQRRGDAKKEIPLRLCYSAPSREQKKKTFQRRYPAVDGHCDFARTLKLIRDSVEITQF